MRLLPPVPEGDEGDGEGEHHRVGEEAGGDGGVEAEGEHPPRREEDEGEEEFSVARAPLRPQTHPGDGEGGCEGAEVQRAEDGEAPPERGRDRARDQLREF